MSGGPIFRLDGKVAFISGAGSGMGAGIASMMARQGARVIVNDLVPERAEETAASILREDGQAIAAAFDITSLTAVRDSCEKLARDNGGIDILVNNAGNAGGSQFVPTPFADMRPEDWDAFLSVNMRGVLNCTHALLPGMRDRGWGRIVTISSDAGRIAAVPGVSVYGAAKAGAAHFMRHIALETAEYGVTANTLCLGHMNTIGEPYASEIVRQIPCGRLGTPEDVASAALFLASQEASWITGATLAVNGGYPAI
ncbi:SDR family NAD(P)-dependent oxidoreductase [Pacificimonas sp. ICDLI1SI03]